MIARGSLFPEDEFNLFINEDNLERMTALFREASRQELIFWQMAGGDDHE